jgi:HK97 gp10 family phage protein
MADDIVGLKIGGFDDLKRRLNGMPKKLRKRAIRNALAAGGRVVRNEAQKEAPVLSTSTKYRARGAVRKAIKVRTSKRDTRGGDVGVYVNVKPLTKAAIRTFKTETGLKGSQNPDDPFFWRFINWDTKRGGRTIPGHKFLEAGAAKLPDALKVFEDTLGPQVQKLDRTPDDPL